MPSTKSKSKNLPLSKFSKKIQKTEKKSNAFETLINTKKTDMNKILSERKNLITEYLLSKKKNEVQDRRFLADRQNNAKDILKPPKFQIKEKKRMKIFDLESDEEDNELKMTHAGKPIEEIDDFANNLEDIEVSSADEQIDANVVNDFHFQGFENDNEDRMKSNQQRKKSKQEIYKEIINKSKKLKYEKQQLRFQNQMKVQDIDNEFEDIMGLLCKKGINKGEKKEKQKKNFDDYDKIASELNQDKRIKPEANNTEIKTKKNKTVRFDLNNDKDSSDGSRLGDDEDFEKMKGNRKLKNQLSKQKKNDKFASFLNDIKALNNEEEEEQNESDSLDEIDLEESDSDTSNENEDEVQEGNKETDNMVDEDEDDDDEDGDNAQEDDDEDGDDDQEDDDDDDDDQDDDDD